MNKQRNNSTNDSWRKAAALALAIALGASACSGPDDGEAATGDAESDFTSQTTSAASRDSESDFAEEASGDVDTEVSEDAEAMEDDEAMAASDESDDGGFSIVDEPETTSTTTAESDDGGFFGETEEEPEPDQFEDNFFAEYGVRDFIETSVDPLSTFALDVDTASYTIASQWIGQGQLPPREAVRVEEFVNSFDYDYDAPRDGLNAMVDGGPSPFDEDNVIVRVGVQGEIVANEDRPAASLTFVIDTSGSMDRQDRLGLVKDSLETLVDELDDDDTVAIVTYSSEAEIVLEPTSVRDADDIYRAIDRLRPDGSTNLESGLITAYDLANESFDRDGINRVILASDGVANVGLTDPDGLVELIRRDADRGIQLVTLGVGMGNFNDVVMETLADDGDGFYAYVNSTDEADRLFRDELVSTLLTVAIDGKIQVEFDSDNVESYRLIGFENRAVLDDDFRNDGVDAGELGAGHQVTAIYELELARGVGGRDDIGTVALRWEDPDTGDVIEGQIDIDASDIEDRWTDTDEDFRLAVTVAAFAEILRESPFADEVTLEEVAEEAENLIGRTTASDDDVENFADLVRTADDLS